MNSSADDPVFSLISQSYRTILQQPDSRRKLQLFSAMLPPGCRNILDVGGASGWVTSGVRTTHSVITQDINFPSLLAGDGVRILSDAEYLPFPDHSFDMVMSSQVLEHLPAAVLPRVCQEMERVAKTYLWVSVPYRENRHARLVRCAQCGAVFHTDHHLRSFTEQELSVLFTDWVMAEWHVFGAVNDASGVSARALARKIYAWNAPPAGSTTCCPVCGQQGSASSPGKRRLSLGRRALSWTHRHLKAMPGYQIAFLPQGQAPYWIAALFILKGSGIRLDSDIHAGAKIL